ncbi:MAG: cysteine hydrolase [Candidatus Aureabacteria bacterium]|nr:cysteine hydrolase [Candidatus Auribacterota bacterium]
MNPVLLTIDIQKDFTKLFTLLKPLSQFEKSVEELTSFFRKEGLPIVHLLTVHREDRSTWTLHMKRDNFRICMEGTEGARELECVGRTPHDTVMHKTRWSAFYGTGLERFLKDHGYDTLVLAGFLTHACIRVSALDAFQRDYTAIIARDCVDTYDADHERITLDYLSRYVAKIMSNADIFKLLGTARREAPRLTRST